MQCAHKTNNDLLADFNYLSFVQPYLGWDDQFDLCKTEKHAKTRWFGFGKSSKYDRARFSLIGNWGSFSQVYMVEFISTPYELGGCMSSGVASF